MLFRSVVIGLCLLSAAAGYRANHAKEIHSSAGANLTAVSLTSKNIKVEPDMPEDYCKDIERYLRKLRTEAVLGKSAVAFGTDRTVSCYVKSDVLVKGGIEANEDILLFSSSKWVFVYTVLKMVDLGMLNLDTRPADLFDWWTKDNSDMRSAVTLRHLLSQTDGMGQYFGFAMAVGCWASTSLGCAKQAYESTFKQSRPPGTNFIYSETSFFVASAMVLHVTGMDVIDDVFRKYMAEPLGLSPTCRFDYPTKEKAWAGGGLQCNMADYTTFLMHLQAKTLVSKELHEEAERPHTLRVENWPPPAVAGVLKKLVWAPGQFYHYGLGQWLECKEADCSGGVLRTNCVGAAGTFPWINRKRDTTEHWGVVARKRFGGYGPASMRRIYDKILAKVGAFYGDRLTGVGAGPESSAPSRRE